MMDRMALSRQAEKTGWNRRRESVWFRSLYAPRTLQRCIVSEHRRLTDGMRPLNTRFDERLWTVPRGTTVSSLAECQRKQRRLTYRISRVRKKNISLLPGRQRNLISYIEFLIHI